MDILGLIEALWRDADGTRYLPKPATTDKRTEFRKLFEPDLAEHDRMILAMRRAPDACRSDGRTGKDGST